MPSLPFAPPTPVFRVPSLRGAHARDGPFQDKLDRKAYVKLDEFEADVLRVFDNAKTYNMPKSEIYTDATVLQARSAFHPCIPHACIPHAPNPACLNRACASHTRLKRALTVLIVTVHRSCSVS